MPITLASRAWALLSRKAVPTAPQATIKISPRTAIGFRLSFGWTPAKALRRAARSRLHRCSWWYPFRRRSRRGPVTTPRSSYDAAVQLRRRGPVTTPRSSYDAAVQLRRRGPVTTPRSSYDAAVQLRRRGPVTTPRSSYDAAAQLRRRGPVTTPRSSYDAAVQLRRRGPVTTPPPSRQSRAAPPAATAPRHPCPAERCRSRTWATGRRTGTPPRTRRPRWPSRWPPATPGRRRTRARRTPRRRGARRSPFSYTHLRAHETRH